MFTRIKGDEEETRINDYVFFEFFFFSLRLFCFGLDVGQNVVMIAAMETGLGELKFEPIHVP